MGKGGVYGGQGRREGGSSPTPGDPVWFLFVLLCLVRGGMQVKRVAPTEFEAMAGRGSTKKWKDSVKIGPDLPEFEGRAIGAYMREELGVRNPV